MRPLNRRALHHDHVYNRSADVTKYSLMSRVELIILPTIAIRHHGLWEHVCRVHSLAKVCLTMQALSNDG